MISASYLSPQEYINASTDANMSFFMFLILLKESKLLYVIIMVSRKFYLTMVNSFPLSAKNKP